MSKDTQDQVQPPTPPAGSNLPAEREPAAGQLVTPGNAVQLVIAALDSIPTVEEDPTESMIAAIMAAEDPSDMDAIFEALHFKENVAQRVTVHTFRPLAGDTPGMFGKYLLLDVTMLETGERRAMSCSATMAMVQLLWYWRKGLLPFDFEIVAKKRPTKAGFVPLHLRPLGRPRGWTADATNGQ